MVYLAVPARRLEQMSAAFASGGQTGSWNEIQSDIDRDMAVVANVHSAENSALEVAVGRPLALYAVVPHGGALVLTRGAAFSYYEFTHPSAGRMTDEAWQRLRQSPAAPPPPDWMESYLVPAPVP